MGSIYTRDGSYGIDYRDHLGRRIRKVVARDKSVAQKMLSDAVATAERMKAGILVADPREGRLPFEGHVQAYTLEMHRRGRDQMYVYNVTKHIENAAREQGWKCLADCTPKSISGYLRKLHTEGLSAKTVNSHRSDLSAFFGWAVRSGMLEANPCDRVGKSAVKNEPTRRALSVPECRALIESSPESRKTVYLFLVYTGLRRAEAEALRWGHVHLGTANPHVELPASITKSGRAETVPLVAEVAEALERHRGGAGRDEPVFERIPSMDVFRADLAAAGIAEEDERGRKVVVHSLRHSLATMLAASQVPPALAMRILRHRDIKLTLVHYTDEALLPLAAAMATLPRLAGA